MLWVAAVAVVAAAAGSEPAPMLPDLKQELPQELSVTEADGRVRLGFRSATQNIGRGPLIVVGKRDADERTMRATQRIRTRDERTIAKRHAGRLLYIRSDDHEHWHYQDFMRYELRRESNRRLVRPSLKTGFCLGDRYDIDSESRLKHEPEAGVYITRCGLGRPDQKRITEGISVGYADHYHPFLEGQHFDITNLRAGRYWLIHRADAPNRLSETHHDNNAASVLIELTRDPLAVRVLRECPNSAFCS